MRPIVAVVIMMSIALPGARAAQGKAVAEMIEELKKGEAEKFKAMEALEALGDKASDAAPALIDLFGDKSESVRLQAAITLGKIGSGAVAPLNAALDAHYNGKKEAAQATRFYLVWSLGFVGAPAKNTTPLVVKALADPAADVRRKAAYTLGRIDADPKLVVDALVAALTDADNDVRQTAAESLPKMSKTAVPVLIRSLKAGKDDLKPIVIRILGQIGADAAPALPELKAFLLEGKALAAPAAEALASIGAKALPELTAAAASDNATVRAIAVQSLHKIGAPAVPTFVDLLGSKHVDVQRHVAALLGGMLVQDKSVVIALGFATKDKDTQVRTNALNSLRQMGSGAKLAEPYILELLTDLDPNIRLTAFQTLQNLGIDARPGLKKALANPDAAVRITTASLMIQLNFEVELATPALVDGLKDKNNDLKMQAAHALSSRGLRGDEVLPIFLDGLKSANPGVRRQALESIARYGAKANSAGSALIAALDDRDDAVAVQAINTLNAVGAEPKALFHALAKVLGSKKAFLHPMATAMLQRIPEATLAEGLKDPELRVHAAFGLSHQGAQADLVVPIFLEGLKSNDDADRARAISSIARYGPKAAKSAGPALINAIDDPDTNICGLAINALRSVGADAKELFPAMVRVLRRKDTTHHYVASQIIFQVGPTAIDQITALLKKEDAPGIRLACLQTLAMVGPPAKDALPELIRALGDEAPRARMTAARALGNLGPAAKDAEAALTKATKDTDANVQQIAQAALSQIKVDANLKNFEVKGVLTVGDPTDRIRKGHFHVVHTYPMKKGQQYQIDLISIWDNYLRLENPRGDNLAENDDGGGYPNARIVFTAPDDGWYRIIVTSFSSGGNGPYTLRVK